MSIYIGHCPIGGVPSRCGMLEIMINPVSKKSYVRCDECLVEWDHPENALYNIKGYRESFSGVVHRAATMDEVEAMGWEIYIDYSLTPQDD